MSSVALYMQWFSVEQRMPDEELFRYRERFPDGDINLIVLIKGASVPTELYYNGYDFVDIDEDIYSVTHWMCMPPLPNDCVASLDLEDDFEPEYEKLEVLFLPGV